MGLGGRGADWNAEGFLSHLEDRFELVTFDNRGTGSSDRPRGPYSLDVMADEAVGVLDALGRRRAHVMGISMGGMIAQLVALRHPGRVERLVLVATHGGGAGVTPPTPAAMAAFTQDRAKPREAIVRDAMTAVTAPGFPARDPASMDAIVAIALAQPTPEEVFAHQIAAVLSSDRSARLPSLAVPTLVVHGTEDPLIPVENGRAIAGAVPGARLVELPGCGHLPMWEAPVALAAAVGGFLGPPG
jgi:pimeloyl-ACP methyl ester carboxylesterase